MNNAKTCARMGKTGFSLFLYLFCALAILFIVQPAVSSSAPLDDAVTVADSGDIEEAIKRVDAVLEKDPDNVQAQFLKATLLADTGKIDEAQSLLEEIAQKHPGIPEAHNNLAVLHASRGGLQEAKAILEGLIVSHPNFATAHENLGDVYVALANEEIDKAIRLGAGSESARRKIELLEEVIEYMPLDTPAQQDSPEKSQEEPVAKQAEVAVDTPPAEELVVQRIEEPEIGVIKEVAAPPKPEDTKAQEQVSAPAPGVSSDASKEAEVRETVNAWLEAWMLKDIDKYGSYYAETFSQSGLNKRRWLNQKRKKFERPNTISVQVEDVRVAFRRGKARVSFVQLYEAFNQFYKAKGYKDKGIKKLKLVNVNGEWKIESESWALLK
ncbi:hypothetical protein MNBD_NITROSPINAE01-1543 [hydrothermal vent metagenome]|uniref:Cds6 C-terminal domain-containing protein n=1 Tax=hydrothermal vent metagenome TaxID=652676 RepID=A0A3B1CI37_9ZZZZ